MKTILLIDDEELVIKSIEKLLTKQNYKVFVCRRGDEAFDVVRKEKIDLVICDIRMPNLSGIETVKEIRRIIQQKSKPSVPEILMTGYADNEDNLEAEKLKVSDYVYKPFNLSEFLACVKKNIGDE